MAPPRGHAEEVKEAFHAHEVSDARNFAEIKTELRDLTAAFHTHVTEMKEYRELMELRVRTLENSFLKLVTKFSIYGAIGLFLGNVLVGLIFKFL